MDDLASKVRAIDMLIDINLRQIDSLVMLKRELITQHHHEELARIEKRKPENRFGLDSFKAFKRKYNKAVEMGQTKIEFDGVVYHMSVAASIMIKLEEKFSG